ncbi:MAG: chorismate-binding protein [Polaromonas sp.]
MVASAGTHALITALIDFEDPQGGPRLRHAFGQPLQTLLAHTPDQLRPLLDAVQQAAQRGHWCVGSVRYEAAAAFDAALSVHVPDGALACFAVYDQPLPWPEEVPEAQAHATWQPSLQRPAFDAAIATIHTAIQRGDVYQVNFTAPMTGTLAVNADEALDARALFAALQRAQPGGYAAWLNLGDEQVLSVSPELFFDWNLADTPGGQTGQLLARPMKGTAPRGVTAEDDSHQAQTLRTSHKERAENVMVVDLLRNDMSRVAQPFSVQVPRLFHTQALPSVWQMTSDVTATTRPGCTLADVFAALFPCGSVTGAPKVQAMHIIKALEAAPRGVYCGAVGVVRPIAKDMGGGLHATFNVPIRTVTAKARVLRCSTGSGITADATAEGEWREWQHKRAFVQRASQPFELLETLALVGGHHRHAPQHLARLASAAAHFGFVDNGAAVQALTELATRHPQGAWRVRLLLDVCGQARAEAFALPESPSQVQLQLADRPLIEAHSEFTRYKTTRRAHYDAFTPTESGVFDTVLWNEQGEITECTRGNVAMLVNGRWVTPPLACGLLGGVGRALALQSGRLVEAVVRVDELERVQGWAFLNSLRGWVGAVRV